MSVNIANFIKKLLPSFDKNDIESDLETSLEYIDTIVSGFSSFNEIYKVAKFESKEAKDLIKDFYKELEKTKHKVKLTPTRVFPSDVTTLFLNAKPNGQYLLDEISRAVNDVIVSQALTAYKANLIRGVSHYSFLTRYALDLLNYLYVVEAENGKIELSKEYKLNKAQREFITKHVWIFARMLAVYGDTPEEFKSNLERIDEINLPKEEVDSVIDTYNLDKVDLFDNLPANFIGSPIYSIRLVFAQWEADRYRKLQDQKKLLELRYLHLKLMKEQGSTDVNLEKEIESLQKRISTIDYKLAKIEEDVKD